MPEVRWQRSGEVAVVDRGTRVVVLALSDPTTARPLVLEGPAAAVWHALAERGTSHEVAERVAASVGLPVTAVEPDVAAFLEQLAAVALVGPPTDDTGVAPATTRA